MSEKPKIQKEEEEQHTKSEIEGKNIAYYQSHVDAWFLTRLEKDKAIFTVSSVGIGFLATILTTVGIKHIYEL